MTTTGDSLHGFNAGTLVVFTRQGSLLCLERIGLVVVPALRRLVLWAAGPFSQDMAGWGCFGNPFADIVFVFRHICTIKLAGRI